MNTKLSILCDKFIEAGWLAALILTPLYMNIYTHRMFEPDKATIVRCLALLMMAFYIAKLVDTFITRYRPAETPPPQNTGNTAIHFIKNQLFIGFGLFVIAYIISVLFSAVPYNSLWGGYDRMQGLYTSAGYWVIFLLVALNLRTKEQIDRIISTIIFTSLFIVVYAFIQRLGQDPVPWQQMDPSVRACATFGNPHFLATYLIIIIPLTLYKTIHSLNDKWLFPIPIILYCVIVLLQVITVFLTRSYSAIVVMFLGVSAFFFIYGWSSRKIVSASLGAFILIGGVIYFALFYMPKIITIENLPKGIGAIESRPGTSARINVIMWKGVWGLITDKDNPFRFIIGYGPESLSTVYYKNYTMELAKLEGANVHADRAHSFYLDIWVWHGIIGLFAYLLILISLIYLGFKTTLLKTPPNQNAPPDNFNIIVIGFISALIAHIIESLVNITTTQSFTYFWIFAAVIYALYRIKIFPPTEETITEVKPDEPQVTEPPNDFITIYSTHDPSEISIIRMKLQDSGMPFIIQNENLQNMLPGVDGFIAAQIQALRNDANNAKLLLQGIVKDANQITNQNILNIPETFNWKLYSLIGYATFTIIIAFALFSFSWPASRMITPEIKSVRDALLFIFLLWMVLGLILGVLIGARYLFWVYVGQTLLLAVIMVRRYWPDNTTDTDLLMIYSWGWFLLGFIIGALSIRNSRKPVKWGNPETVMAGIIALAVAFFVVINVNLPVLRADGFYKFCFSYDQSAEEVARQGKRDDAYQIRLMCIRYFQNALRFAPDERAYLNGAGRNFLELAKLSIVRSQENDIDTPNKLHTVPTIKEIIETDFVRRDDNNRLYSDYTYRDFAVLSYTCIQRAYELDPRNYERIIALIRVHRYLGDIDRDKTFLEKALKLCDEARKASPRNTKTDEEIRELQQRLKAFLK
ncbi:MAG: O-antigen ligase family protein [Planctomycetota bacterium]